MPENDDLEENAPLINQNYSQPRTETRNKFKKFLGMLSACTSGACFTLTGFFVKVYKVNVLDFLTVRATLQIIGPLILLAVQCRKCWPSFAEKPLSLVALLGFYAVVTGYLCIGNVIAVSMLPLGDALTFLFTSPVFTALVGRLCFGMKLRAYKVLCIAVLTIGVVLLVQPPFIFDSICDQVGCIVHDMRYFCGVLIGLSVALCFGIGNNMVSKPVRHIPIPMLILTTGCGGFMISLIASGFDDTHRILSPKITEISGAEWGLFLGLGALAVATVAFKLIALHIVEPTTASVFRSLEIVLGYILQVTVMKEQPNALGIAGAITMVSSVMALPFEQMAQQKAPECIKKYL